MSNTLLQIYTLASKEVSDNRRTYLLSVMTGFMLTAGLIALVVAALALQSEVATYESSLKLLLSMGMAPDSLSAPTYLPLKLLRGFIEYIEIIGAILGIVLGHRAAASERTSLTLPLLLSRPLSKASFIAGKCLGNMAVIIGVLALMFGLGTIGIVVIGRVHVSWDDGLRILGSFAAATLYIGFFFALGFLLALRAKRPANAILLAFTIWLSFVLITPQIGDTLDPDNQVGAGVFRTLGIPKVQELQIMKSFSTYETVRDSIEQSSPAKHFERWSFALLGIKETYVGQPVSMVMNDRRGDAFWLIGLFSSLMGALFFLPGNFSNLKKE